MNTPQIIKSPSGEEMVVLSKQDYDALMRAANEAAEDAADIAIYDARKSEFGEAKSFPAELSMAILRGEGRLKAIRKWRGLSQSEVAKRTGITQGFLSDLENRRRKASLETAVKLAEILDVEISWIED